MTTLVDVTYVNKTQPTIDAPWLNMVNRFANDGQTAGATKGAALIPYTPAASGGAGRTSQAKMGDWVSALDFAGVDPTGVGDSTTGLQNAINSLKYGGVLLIPPGVYKLTAALTVPAGVTLQGMGNVDKTTGVRLGGETPTFLYQSTAATPCLQILGASGLETPSQIHIKDLSLSALAAPLYTDQPVTGVYGIHCRGTPPYSGYHISIERCSFYNFERGISVVGYDTGSGVDWQFDNAFILQCNFYQCLEGMYFNTLNADDWHIDNCTFNVAPNGYGIHLIRSGYMLVESSYAVPGFDGGGSPATGCEFVRFSDFPDQLKMLQCAGTDGLAYFLHVDTSTGFETKIVVIDLDGCVVEVPLLLERECHVVSKNTRYLSNPTASGDDIQVESYSDTFDTPATGWVMSGLRPRFSQFPNASGSVAGVLTATFTTMFTALACPGLYIFYVYIEASTQPNLYTACANIACDGTQLFVLSKDLGTNMDIQISGLNVQAKQSSGSTQTVKWMAQRLSGN